MSFAVGGRMLVVDASVLYEVVSNGRMAGVVSEVLAQDPEHGAPQLVDAELLGLLRRDALQGRLDATASRQAVLRLAEWPGERFAMAPFVERVWDLRENVRTWDAFYVALAEVLGCRLVTLDGRLASAVGPRCEIQVLG